MGQVVNKVCYTCSKVFVSIIELSLISINSSGSIDRINNKSSVLVKIELAKR